MAEHDTLGSRVEANLRKSVATQGKAYAQYGGLLSAFADKKIKATDFGRKAFDLYVGAVRDTVSVGVEIAKDAVQTGVDRFAEERGKADTIIKEVAKPVKARKRATAKTNTRAAAPRTTASATKSSD